MLVSRHYHQAVAVDNMVQGAIQTEDNTVKCLEQLEENVEWLMAKMKEVCKVLGIPSTKPGVSKPSHKCKAPSSDM